MRWAASSVAVLALVTGCSAAAGQACTEIGAPSGISVTVAADLAEDVETLSLAVCTPGGCADHRVELSPGSDAVNAGCAGDEPDAPCSATMTPNATLVGFVELPDLSAGTIEVGATVTGQDTDAQTFPPVEVAVEPTYPNGPQCPAEGNQALVTLSGAGLR